MDQLERARPRRAGFTLIEMMISITLLLMIFAIAIPFFRAQVAAVDRYGGRLDAMMNARFGVSLIDRDLRIAGDGVLDQQPMIVQAAPMAITFNADMKTKSTADVGAVYYDTDADTNAVVELTSGNAVTLPLSAVNYPDSTYRQSGTLGSAETISYWLSADPQGTRGDEYILYRRVNNTTAQIVAKNIIIPAGQPAFRYYKTDTLGQAIEINQGLLPIYHSAAIHGSPGDTARSALTDSIRSVRVKLAGMYHDPRRGDIIDTSTATIRIMNAGLINRSSCGEPPVFGQTVTATVDVGPPASVTLTWNRATDESGGEKDVERYALFKRASGASAFGEPFTSIAAGLTTYSYTDTDVGSGQSLIYGVAAQDCTPSTSSIAQSSTVVIP